MTYITGVKNTINPWIYHLTLHWD